MPTNWAPTKMKSKANNVKTYKGKHYVDVTDGADVYDHAEITGNLPAGYRLGYGGGFFDRTLDALHPRPLSIGVGFELNRVETIRPETHDMRLNVIVTEAGIMAFG